MQLLSSSLVVFALFVLSCDSQQSYEYVIDQEERNSIGGEFYPFCVEVTNVVPAPYSILQPKGRSRNGEQTEYAFRITFSRPVLLTNNDTTAGYHPTIIHRRIQTISNSDTNWIRIRQSGINLENVPPIFLSPSLSTPQPYYPFKIANWGGSSREFVAFFSVPTSARGLNIALAR